MAELCAFPFVVPVSDCCGLLKSLQEISSLRIVVCHEGILEICCLHDLSVLRFFSVPLEAVARTVQAKSGVRQTIPLQTPIIRFVLILERRPFDSKVIY